MIHHLLSRPLSASLSLHLTSLNSRLTRTPRHFCVLWFVGMYCRTYFVSFKERDIFTGRWFIGTHMILFVRIVIVSTSFGLPDKSALFARRRLNTPGTAPAALRYNVCRGAACGAISLLGRASRDTCISIGLPISLKVPFLKAFCCHNNPQARTHSLTRGSIKIMK